MTEYDPLHVPDVILEQYRLGELPREQAARVARLSHLDEGLRRRIEALDRSDEDIARQYPPAWLARAIGARLPRRSAAWAASDAWRYGFPLAIAAIVLVLALPRELLTPAGGTRPMSGTPAEENATPAETERIKGLRPSLAMYRNTDHGSETLADGTVARRGDLVRVAYGAGRRAYGVILSIDGRGMVTLHLPPNGAMAATLRQGRMILLDQAYELDDAPGWERFYFVTGDTAFEVAPIMDAARRAAARNRPAPPAALAISRELDQAMFSLQKEVRP